MTETLELTGTTAQDPNSVPHLLSALDKYLMQNPDQELALVVQDAAEALGVELGSLSNEALTAYLKEHATQW